MEKQKRIGIIVPDRNDRPEFLENCLRMIKNQILNNVDIFIKVVDYQPINNECDITPRYKFGYNFFKNFTINGFDLDCILLMENDDYYSPNYIQTMIDEWINHGEPDIFGTNYTYYYHIVLLKFKQLIHYRRSSAMNTLIKPNLNIVWPKDNDPYTDLHLWKQLNGITFEPKNIISIGIKHNVGKTGGQYHSTKLDRYIENDKEMLFLNKHMDNESLKFYKSIHEKIQSISK